MAKKSLAKKTGVKKSKLTGPEELNLAWEDAYKARFAGSQLAREFGAKQFDRL